MNKQPEKPTRVKQKSASPDAVKKGINKLRDFIKKIPRTQSPGSPNLIKRLGASERVDDGSLVQKRARTAPPVSTTI